MKTRRVTCSYLFVLTQKRAFHFSSSTAIAVHHACVCQPLPRFSSSRRPPLPLPSPRLVVAPCISRGLETIGTRRERRERGEREKKQAELATERDRTELRVARPIRWMQWRRKDHRRRRPSGAERESADSGTRESAEKKLIVAGRLHSPIRHRRYDGTRSANVSKQQPHNSRCCSGCSRAAL